MQESKKVGLVTGANKGIGFEVARQLGKAGWTVLAGARNEELGRQAVEKLLAEGLDVHFIQLDLDAPESAVKAAQSIRERFGKLNVLINNAGVSSKGDGPPSKVDLEVVKKTMNTNFLGTVAVTQAMLPMLQAAAKAQIINVSSELGSISQQTNPAWKYAPVKVLAYCASKAALNLLSVQLAYEFRDENIAVNSVNPGYTATDLNGNSGPQTVEEGAAEIVRLALLDSPPTGKFLETDREIPW
jgi:NAD(P)-dependent dehydrogenase (short-subunit alcohol dehydrogenase family)